MRMGSNDDGVKDISNTRRGNRYGGARGLGIQSTDDVISSGGATRGSLFHR